MTAEAVIPVTKPPSLPDWVFPPPEGFVAEDLDHIPDLPAHTELIDGSLVFVSPQRDFHTSIMYVLQKGLLDSVPTGHRVRREMGVKLGPRQRPEPDMLVLRPETRIERDTTFFEAEDVLLVVEVESPDSEERDRKRKPLLYAEAGIKHFWRVENDANRTVVYVYQLDPATSVYALTGIHHDRLKLTVPFDLDIDLTEIDQL
ncbi:Uma2 family endonuclease [Nonomuraea sp. NPDC059194]|uniref:Uma2 family endonuclease n=1 Tax=Nonomuraea sp. NPDC059194 TaxID=3346764 RepID=UPI003697BA47